MDTELFRGWLTDHFLEHAVDVRPLLVLLDGHSSHYQPDLIRFARDHDIILFCLPQITVGVMVLSHALCSSSENWYFVTALPGWV